MNLKILVVSAGLVALAFSCFAGISTVHAVDTPPTKTNPTKTETPTTNTTNTDESTGSSGSGSTSGSTSGSSSGSSCGSAAECINSGVDQAGGSNANKDMGSFLKSITDTLLFVLGAGAVIMIVIGGIRYATSNGDQNTLTGAKNTILYAVIGLVLAIMAYAIVNFVVVRFTN